MLQISVTLVTAEAIMLLYNLIKQNIYILDETSMPRLQRYIQKLAKAGQTSIAYRVLFEEQNSLLTSINDEAKTRRSTKSVVLGKEQGKVMSFETLRRHKENVLRKMPRRVKGSVVGSAKVLWSRRMSQIQRRRRSQK